MTCVDFPSRSRPLEAYVIARAQFFEIKIGSRHSEEEERSLKKKKNSSVTLWRVENLDRPGRNCARGLDGKADAVGRKRFQRSYDRTSDLLCRRRRRTDVIITFRQRNNNKKKKKCRKLIAYWKSRSIAATIHYNDCAPGHVVSRGKRPRRCRTQMTIITL